MTTYNSFEEAKIANPECEIIRWNKSDEYKAVSKSELSGYLTTWCHCNPANHCMTNNEFLSGGNSITKGDIVLDNGRVFIVSDHYDIETYNSIVNGEDTTYILRAAALEKQTESAVKDSPKRTKVEYVKVDFASDKEKAEAFIEGGLRYFTHGEVRGDLERDTIPVTRLDELLCGNAIYKRIETEIDDREEFIATAFSLDGVNQHPISVELVGKMYDSGKFKLVESKELKSGGFIPTDAKYIVGER